MNVVWFYLMDIFFLISLTSNKLLFLWSFWVAIAFSGKDVPKQRDRRCCPADLTGVIASGKLLGFDNSERALNFSTSLWKFVE